MGTVLSNHSRHQDIKMKFLIPLLVVLATSDAFFLGFGRNPDARDVDIKDTDTEELARLLGEILVRELRNNNYNNHHDDDHDDDDDDDDDDNDHHNSYNNHHDDDHDDEDDDDDDDDNHHHNSYNNHHNNDNDHDDDNDEQPPQLQQQPQ